jgi:predicted ester cyclase
MSIDANNAVVRRFIVDMLGNGQHELAEELFAADYVARSGLGSTLEPGPDGARKAAARLRVGFPDVQYAIEDMIAEGDKVVVRTRWTGTHLGKYGDLAPSGKRVTSTSIHIYRLENGKIAERWLERDRLSMMEQVGVTPEPKGTSS